MFRDGHAKFNLAGADCEVELVVVEGMKLADVRKARHIVQAERDKLIGKWNEIHG